MFLVHIIVSAPCSLWASLQLRVRTVPEETGNLLSDIMLAQVVFKPVQSEIIAFSILKFFYYRMHIKIL